MRSRCKLPPGRETDPEFLARVDSWVGAGASARPEADQLLSLLPGIWPIECLASLRRLERREELPAKYVSTIEAAFRQPRSRRRRIDQAHAPLRSLEHPLDFEWRFTSEGQTAMMRELHIVCGGDTGTVLCLGCPSLFELGRYAQPDRQFVLWDKNASSLGQMHEARALADIDLRHERLPALAAIAAVIDPPWYNDFYQLFMWTALRNVTDDGHILLTFPPDGTRPTATRDREDIIRWSVNAGAELITHRRACLPYRSPLFEVNALKAAGLRSVPLNWRRGDLLVFRKLRTMHVIRPKVSELAFPWEEHRLGCVRLRVQVRDDSLPSPSLRSVAKTAVLPSVSTRFPGRDSANMVTTGNRFFHSTSTLRMSEMLSALASKFAVMGDAREASAKLSDFPAQLSRLVAREQREAAEYFAQVDGV